MHRPFKSLKAESIPEGVGKILEGWILVVDIGNGNIDGGRAALALLVLSSNGLQKISLAFCKKSSIYLLLDITPNDDIMLMPEMIQ